MQCNMDIKQLSHLVFFIRDKDNQVLAGCNGNIGYGWVLYRSAVG